MMRIRSLQKDYVHKTLCYYYNEIVRFDPNSPFRERAQKLWSAVSFSYDWHARFMQVF